MQIGYVLIYLLHAFDILLVKFPSIFLHKRNMQQNTVKPYYHAVFIAIVEEIYNDTEHQREDSEQCCKEGVHLVEIENNKHYNSCHPQEEMRQNMHH